MITITPFWFVETGIYNVNFDIKGIIGGALFLIIWVLVLLPFLVIAFEMWEYDNS